MPYKFKVFILTLLSIPLLLTQATIAEVKTSEIEELKKQILEIQKQNQQQIEMLLKKIESLENKRASDENKMDKLIAKEEAEEQDGWWRKVRAGYKKGLFVESVDGNYKMKMNLRGQFQFAVNDTDGEDTSYRYGYQKIQG
jgi:TolA-binding protein